MNRRFSAPVQIVLAALLFSTGGAAIKGTTFTNWQVAGSRSGLAALALLIALPRARRGWSAAGAFLAIIYALTLILFVSANKLTTAMDTIFLQATSPLYVLALSRWLLHERVDRRDLLVMSVLFVGMLFFFLGSEPPQITAPNPLLGNILAACSGLTWALTIMGFRWLAKRHPESDVSLSAVTMGNLLTCALCLPLAFPLSHAQNTLHNWLVVIFLGVFQIGLAYVFLVGGLAGVPAFTASILLMMEPVFNPIWTYLFHREVPSGWAIVGALLILGATLVKAWMGPATQETDVSSDQSASEGSDTRSELNTSTP